MIATAGIPYYRQNEVTMIEFARTYRSFDGGIMAMAGFHLRRVLSAELFLEMAGRWVGKAAGRTPQQQLATAGEAVVQ